MRSPWLLLPLVVVALVGAAGGFFVTRQLAPATSADGARVSVITLPSTPTPEPTLSPSPAQTAGSGSRSSRVRVTEDTRSCPAGCQCQFPQNGIVIRC